MADETREREITDYYTEMIPLWQELDLSFKEKWECPDNSVRYRKKLENGSVQVSFSAQPRLG